MLTLFCYSSSGSFFYYSHLANFNVLGIIFEKILFLKFLESHFGFPPMIAKRFLYWMCLILAYFFPSKFTHLLFNTCMVRDLTTFCTVNNRIHFLCTILILFNGTLRQSHGKRNFIFSLFFTTKQDTFLISILHWKT